MLDTYIKATAGLAKWLLFAAMAFFGPLIRIVCGGLSLLFLVGFVIGLIIQSSHPFAHTVLYACLGFGLLFSMLFLFYEILFAKMFLERIDNDNRDEDQEADVSRRMKLMNWLGVFTLLAGFSGFSYHVYHFKIDGIENWAVGFVWWLSAGIVLGVCRWFYRQGAGAIAALLLDVKAVIAGWRMRLHAAPAQRSMTDDEIKSAAKAFLNDSKVVPFRRRG